MFPGTSERVLTLSGELPSVLTAVHLISTKLQSETNNGISIIVLEILFVVFVVVIIITVVRFRL